MEFIGYFATLAMGIVLGMMGGGGAILTVPILVYLFHMTPTVASRYSLFIVGLTALVGCLAYMRRREVNWRALGFFAVPSVAGMLTSRNAIIPSIPEKILSLGAFTLTRDIVIMGAFAMVMLAAARSMLVPRKSKAAGGGGHPLSLTIQGYIVGLIAGFVGAGGGFLIVPSLVVFAGLPMRTAVGTSLIIIATQSLAGFFGSHSIGAADDWSLLIRLAMIAIAGIVVGSLLSKRVPEAVLKRAFGWFVLVMGTIIFVEQLIRMGKST